MKATFTGFAAIRRVHDTHEEWIDTDSISTDSDHSREKAHKLNTKISGWAHDNPIRRFTRITITED